MFEKLGRLVVIFIVIFFLQLSIALAGSESEEMRLLYKAIEAGDLDRVKINFNDVNINHQDSWGYTPLYKAVFYNRKKIVEHLFRNGADVNLADVEGLAPLHVSALENLPDLALALKKMGANIEAKDNYGYTPLHLAADQGSLQTAQLLVSRGANVNTRSEWGGTP